MSQKVFLSCVPIASVPVTFSAGISKSPSGYLIGVIIAMVILGYLIYVLIRPEKF
jgi:K+-transporting ATPase KdpF subunit